VTCCLPRTHPVPNGETDLQIQFHGENAPALPAARKGKTGRVLLRLHSGTIPPPPWQIFPPPLSPTHDPTRHGVPSWVQETSSGRCICFCVVELQCACHVAGRSARANRTAGARIASTRTRLIRLP
jgi:hypothetical protein